MVLAYFWGSWYIGQLIFLRVKVVKLELFVTNH